MYSIFCIFLNADFPLYLNQSRSSTLYFPSPPLLLIRIQLWVKSLAGKNVYRPGSALYKKVTKTGCVLFDWSELNGQGSFSFKTHFFSWFSNVFCFLNDSKNKMHFSQHFFLKDHEALYWQ